MPSSTPSPVTRLEVISVGARQRWTPDRKRALVAETFEPGAKVSAVARRNGVATSLLFAWRKQLRDELAPVSRAAEPSARFLPLAIAAEGGAATLELEMAGGARLRITGRVDADLVAAIITALARR
jgi:transposase